MTNHYKKRNRASNGLQSFQTFKAQRQVGFKGTKKSNATYSNPSKTQQEAPIPSKPCV